MTIPAQPSAPPATPASGPPTPGETTGHITPATVMEATPLSSGVTPPVAVILLTRNPALTSGDVIRAYAR